MIIKSLHLEGFKNQKEPITYHFKRINHFFGDNFTGKTTISDAILFAILGIDRYGYKAFLHELVHTDRTSAIVELRFELNGIEYHLRRSINKNKSNLWLQNKPIGQNELDKLIGYPDLFRYSFILESLSQEESKSAREFMIDLLNNTGIVTMKESFDQLDRQIKNIRSQIKKREQRVAYLFGQKDQIVNRMKEFQANIKEEVEPTNIINHKDFKNEAEDMDDLEKSLENINYKLGQLEENTAHLNRQREELLLKLKAEPPSLETGSRCPVCQQIIFDKQIRHIQEIHDQEIQRNQEALAELSRQLEHNHEEIDDLLTEKRRISEKIEQLKESFKTSKSHLNDHKKIQEILTNMKQELQQIHLELMNVESDNKRDKDTIKSLQEQIAKMAEKYQFEMNSRLHFAKVQLFKTLLNGELRPDYKVFYKNRPFRILSYSEKIRCLLEIVNSFQEIAQTKFPVFIDNLESITELTPPETQIFTASVRKGVKLTLVTKD